ncbi:kinase-like domain-containing protein [Irpex rosettiformis]|uniref:Kinase-like domain-containing protein n=1 Tax=Irpex rosettiformis TaxID=378272 RepID=A0ACB8U579_9APHY|nr:kinase-like domain-containing protein [Irpex rosettiformis]
MVRQSVYIHREPVPDVPDTAEGEIQVSEEHLHGSTTSLNPSPAPAITVLPIDNPVADSLQDLVDRISRRSVQVNVAHHSSFVIHEASSGFGKIQRLPTHSSHHITTANAPDLPSAPEEEHVSRKSEVRPDKTQIPPRPLHLIGSSRKTSPWTALGLLGEGAQGRVYLVKYKRHITAAMKIISLADTSRSTTLLRIVDELIILDRLEEADCHFVLGPKAIRGNWAWTSSGGFLHITTPVCPGGTLLDRGHEVRRSRNEFQVALIAAELVLGIEFLHKLGIVHHDIKPENIVIDSDGHCRITDFGGAKLLPKVGYFSLYNNGQPVMSLDYAAPELIKCFLGNNGFDVEYTKAVDWWALGATLLAILLDDFIVGI